MVTKLDQLAGEMFRLSKEDNPELAGIVFPAAVALQVAEVSLRIARTHIVTLGGKGSTNGDTIQKAILDQIDAALERK